MSTFEWVMVGTVFLLVLCGGAWVAVWWWRLVARAAPYEDEVGRVKGPGKKGESNGNVVVIGGDSDRPPGAKP